MTADGPAPGGNGKTHKTLAMPGSRSVDEFWLDRYHVDLGTRSVRRERVRCSDLEDCLLYTSPSPRD